MQDKISQIKKEYLEKINSAKSLAELDTLFLSLFGKTGAITLIPKEFSRIPREELKIITPIFIDTKNELEKVGIQY